MGALASSYTLEDQRRMTRAANYFAWQSRLVGCEIGSRVVEVGAGIGNFTQTILDRELVIALDRDADCIAALREQFPNRPNLKTFVLDAGNGGVESLKTFRPDSCVCLNVLEHIQDDEAALQKMASMLSPGGVVVLIVPAFAVLFGPIDRNLGHYRRYDRRSLLRLAGKAGLRPVKLHYLNFVGFFGWWINAHILKRQAQSPAQIDFFDRRVVPTMSRLEAMIHPPFGQSLLAVFKKP